MEHSKKHEQNHVIVLSDILPSTACGKSLLYTSQGLCIERFMDSFLQIIGTKQCKCTLTNYHTISATKTGNEDCYRILYWP